MSLKFPVSEWFESSGNAAAEFQEALRDGIATFACTLWSQFPNFIVNGRNPTSSFARGFMNQACSPIQPPVPFPDNGFSGGQCDTLYTVRCVWDGVTRVQRVNVQGAIQSVVCDKFFTDRNNYTLQVVDRDGNTFNSTVVDVATTVFNGAEIDRQDGLPDDCGDAPFSYPVNPPSAIDLETTINITNLDGVDNTYVLTYNQINNQYNFPIGFKLDGINVIVDVGGITIYGDPYSTSPNTPNDSPPPGSDGGRDGEGTDYVVVFTEQVYPVTSDYVQPETIEQEIEYLLCQDGVVETIIETISTVLPLDPIFEIILLILGQVITELCEGVGGEALVGLPEYYPVLPGTERPAIVYLYKEVVDGIKQKPTYSSTVSNPSATAVANIPSVNVPNKTVGQYVCSVTLTDGTRIRAGGDTEMAADTNFNFLIGQVEPVLVPPNINDRKVTTFYPALQVVDLVCVQIEYYPNGKAAGVSPSIRRFIST